MHVSNQHCLSKCRKYKVPTLPKVRKVNNIQGAAFIHYSTNAHYNVRQSTNHVCPYIHGSKHGATAVVMVMVVVVVAVSCGG